MAVFVEWSRVVAIQNEIYAAARDPRRPLAEILHQITDAVDALGDHATSILLANGDGTLSSAAGARIPEAWVRHFDPLPLGRDQGSCGAAGFLRRRVICENVLTDPRWADYRAYQPLHGFMACWSQPIIGDAGELLGTIGVYFKEPRGPQAEEIELIQSLANTVCTIIERRRHESSLRAHRDRLEVLVAERTARLQETEAQLQQSQKLEAIGRLAGGVAHDFNNLLTVILSYGDALLEEPGLSAPARQDLEQIVEAGHRAANLTRQLLTFSRRQPMQVETFDPRRVVQRLATMLERVLGEDIELVTRLAEETGWVRGDPAQMDQVILNLAVNARDAMPRGGCLTIETANVNVEQASVDPALDLEPGAFVMITITDTGSGIEPVIRHKIFDPFFTTKASGEGTGLGLSMVYGIVRQAGGAIAVESTPGLGATFRVYLPRARRDARSTPATPGLETVGEGDARRVLLVDDEPAIRTLLGRQLVAMGYRPHIAAGAHEAVLAVESEGFVPDLLITDVIMPHTSGTALAARLRATRPTLRILYMSGYMDDAIDRHGGLTAGDLFLQKPFTRQEFAEKIRLALDADRGAANAR